MTDQEKKRLLKLIERLELARNRAANSFLRYTWRPGTNTGTKDYERSMKWDGIFEDTLDQLYKILDPTYPREA